MHRTRIYGIIVGCCRRLHLLHLPRRRASPARRRRCRSLTDETNGSSLNYYAVVTSIISTMNYSAVSWQGRVHTHRLR